MDKSLFLFIGKSASGKTTVANLLEQKYEHKQVQSYTTRHPRYNGEVGHIFVTKEEFDDLGDLAAYTLYNDNEYGTTFKQLEECDIYVIDVPGVETLLQKHSKITRPIVILYFDSNVATRINRMIDRGDSDNAIVARLLQDEQYDWLDKLNSVVWKHNNLQDSGEHPYVDIHRIDANQNLNNVMKLVLYYINKYKEDWQ